VAIVVVKMRQEFAMAYQVYRDRMSMYLEPRIYTWVRIYKAYCQSSFAKMVAAVAIPAFDLNRGAAAIVITGCRDRRGNHLACATNLATVLKTVN